MNKLHSFLAKNSQKYAGWHNHSVHGSVHFLALALIAVFFSNIILNSGFDWMNESIAWANQSSVLSSVGIKVQNKEDNVPKIDLNSFLIKVKSNSKSLISSSPTPTNTGITSLNNLNKLLGIMSFKQVGKQGKKSKASAEVFKWYKVSLNERALIGEKNPAYKKLDEAMNMYKRDKNIEAVQPNYIYEVNLTPNDPYYSSSGAWGQTYQDLYGMHKIKAAEAWDLTTGSSSIIIADIDTGVDRNHPDLTTNMWVNTAEIQSNGIDDDNNGYIDDYYGWDWCNNDNDPMDDHGHGTHTVGTIAGVGNNSTGVVGVNWTSKIMALKFLCGSGGGSTNGAVGAIQYATDMGAKVTSNSWGGSGVDQALDDAIRYSHSQGVITVAAAGNNNGDALGFSPANSDYVITVAASDFNDAKASFSNWGEKVDVAAPGVYTLSAKAAINNMCDSSITFGTYYCRVSGTSMATPHVAGLAGLILARNPSLTPEEVRQIIRKGANDLGTVGKDSNFGYGRINAFNSVTKATQTRPLTPIITSPRSFITTGGTSLQIKGSILGPNFASYKVEFGAGRTPTSWTQIANSTTQPTAPNSVLATWDTSSVSDENYIIRITAYDTNNQMYQFQVHDVKVDNFEASISSPGDYANKGNVNIIGTAKTNNGVSFGNYKLEVGLGDYPSSWTTLNQSNTSVTNGLLGVWDTSSIPDNTRYTLRLTITAGNGVTSQYQKPVTVDSTILGGWPKMLEFGSRYTPVIGDITGDSKKEIIVSGINYNEPGWPAVITAYGSDGNILSGFPISNAYNIESQTILADLNNDGKQEIIVASPEYSTGRTKVNVYQGNGSLYPGWSNVTTDRTGELFFLDINGDNQKEIVVLSLGYWSTNPNVTMQLSAFNSNGQIIPGFPRNASYTISAPDFHFKNKPSIHDLDGDGSYEIALTIGKVYLFNDELQILPGWPYSLPTTGVTPGYWRAIGDASVITSADFYGDGTRELFLTTNRECQAGSGSFSYYCYGGMHPIVVGLNKDGSLLSGFPKFGDNDNYTQISDILSHADVNNDNADDVVVGSHPLSIYTKNGLNIYGDINSLPDFKTQIHLADIDGDNKIEYVGTEGYAGYYITVVDDNGSTIWERGVTRPNEAPLLADLNNDGKMELVQTHQVTDPNNTNLILGTQMIVWELNFGQNAKYEWPMFAQNLNRDGNLKTIPFIPDTTPPTPPSNLSATAPNSSQVNLTWNASTDNVGVTGYRIYRDGIEKGNSTTTSYSDATVSPNTTYVYTVKAYDLAGNFSGSSNTANITTPQAPTPTPTPSPTPTPTPSDLTPPTVSITSPVNNSTVVKRSNVTITATASDDISVSKVEFYVSGSLKCTDTTAPYSCVWKVPSKAGASYTLTARAYDSSNNITNSTVVNITAK